MKNDDKFKSENKKISNSNNMKRAVELFYNSKRPKHSWKKDPQFVIDFDLPTFYEYNKTLKMKKNYSILTGKKSNLTVIDIDCNKDENINDNVFIKKFGSDPSKWNGVVIKSPSGGFHVYYQYEASLKHGQDAVSHVDVRNDNGLIVSAGSVRDGKTYECIKGDLNDIPKIKDDMIDFIHSIDYYNPANKTNGQKTKTRIKKIKNQDGTKEIIIEEIIGCDQSLYHYDYPDELLEHIIKGLPSRYFESYEGFLIFTTAMKQIDRFDIWEKHPKIRKNPNGDPNKYNANFYHNINGHKTILAMNHLLIHSSYQNARTSLDYFKYKPTLENKIKPAEKVNSEKLGYDFFNERLGRETGKNRFIACRSDTGTGKTTSFKSWKIKHPKERFVSIVSRISLGLEQYETFNNEDIDTAFYENESFYPGENYIVQIDSLLKLEYWADQGGLDGYSIFLDEWNSIVKHLFTSETMTKKGVRIPIMDLLVDIIRNAKFVIMTDADISDQSLRFLDFVLDHPAGEDSKLSDSFVFIENEYKHNNGTPAEELYNIETLVRMMKASKKWICPCDEARSCHLLKEMIGDEQILVIDSRTTERYDWDKYDRIIFSPKVIYGLDSIMKRPVFCFYQESTIDARDMLQQINRNRSITKLYYLFQRKRCRDTDFNTLQNAIEDSDDLKKWCDKNDYLHQEISRVHTIFKDVFNQLKYNSDALSSNPYAHFKKLLKERGFKDSTAIFQSNSQTTRELLKEDRERMTNEIHKDMPFVKENNEKYIGLPEDEIQNFKEIFMDRSFIQRYTALKWYIFYDYGSEYNAESKKWIQEYKTVEERLMNQKKDMKKKLHEKGEFDIKKIVSDQSKLIYLDRLRQNIKMKDRLKINDFERLDEKKAELFYDEYKATFGDRSKKEKKNPLLSNDGTKRFVSMIYKKVFGINPFAKSSTSKKGNTCTSYSDANLNDFGVFHEVFELSKAEYVKKNNQKSDNEEILSGFLIDDDA